MSPMDKHTFVAKINFLVVKVFQTQLKWRALSLGIWLVIQTQKAILWTEFQTRWKFNLRWQSQIVSNLSVEVSNSERSLETLATGTFLSFGLSFDDWKIELWPWKHAHMHESARAAIIGILFAGLLRDMCRAWMRYRVPKHSNETLFVMKTYVMTTQVFWILLLNNNP